MQSFASELGTKFDVVVEAGHVIDKRQVGELLTTTVAGFSTSFLQVWIGSLSQSFANRPLRAVHQSTSTTAFQDDVGEIVAQACLVRGEGR